MYRLALIVVVSGLLSACASGYQLVKAQTVMVSKGTMSVQPTVMWNRSPFAPGGVPSQEAWTQNGPLLDQVWFFGAVKEGQTIARQAKKADRKVPDFKASMLPQDLVSLLESYYRIFQGAKIFETTSVKPTTVAGINGVRVEFAYVYSPGAGEQVEVREVKYRGSAVLAVKDGKLYGLVLHAAAQHYYDASLSEFNNLVASTVVLK